jgi:hypothetical protein
MEKLELESFYFKLDCGWISDPKIQILLCDLGYSAISIYVTIIDWLYQEKGVLNKKHYKYISNQLKCDVELVKQIVEDYELFFFDGDEFSSIRARDEIKKRTTLSNNAKKPKKPKNEN